jgi:hypothetical protein
MYWMTGNEDAQPEMWTSRRRRGWWAVCSLLALLSMLAIGGAPIASAHTGSHFGAYERWLNFRYYADREMAFADVTGDGQADAIVVNYNGIFVRPSLGGSFGAPKLWTPDGAYWGTLGTFFADVDGDYRADAIVVNLDAITVRLSTGAEFGASKAWTYSPFYGTRGTFFADVTGDYRADAIAVTDTGIKVRPAMGNSMTSYQFWPHDQNWTSDPFYGNKLTIFADVTGDGRADAIVVNDESIPSGRVVVRRANANGTGFQANNEEWTQQAFYGSRGTYFVDVTGDYRADAIAVNEDGINVRSSDGSRFLAGEPWTHEAYYGSRGTYFANVSRGSTGCEYIADAIVVNDDGITVRRAPEPSGCLN